MLLEYDMFGKIDKINQAIERLRTFEPDEGYYLAFSGGKDSLCIYNLAKEAGVKFSAFYNHTTVDPPELVYFIRKYFPDVYINYPKESMWELIVRHKIPPTRRVRYCCSDLKENRTINTRVTITGVRWAESIKRKKQRGLVELKTFTKERIIFNNDNVETRRMFETCYAKGKHNINPIIDWKNDDVWEYIKLRNIPYCHLYDCGFKRLGCIGCPLSGSKQMKWEFQRYPKYKQAYIRAFDRMLKARKDNGLQSCWKDGKEVMSWWIGDKKMISKNQLNLFEINESENWI